MKNIYIHVLSALLSCATLVGSAQSNFNKAFSTVNNDDGWYVNQLGNAKYYIAGNSNGSGVGGYNPIVMYLNVNGDTIWTRHVGTQYHDFFVDAAISVTTNDIFIVSEETNGPSWGNNMRITRINDTGSIIWSVTYNSGSELHAKAICATSDGGFAITGEADSAVADSSGIFILKCNANGSLMWVKKYAGTSLTGYGTDICETAGGGYLVSAEIYNYSLNTSRVVVIRTDSQGTVMWCRIIDVGSQVDEPCIAEQQNGDILLSGYAFGTLGNGYVFVAGMTTSGNISWFKSYTPTSGEHYRMFDAFLYPSTGSLNMVGMHDNGTLYSGYILRVSSAGVLQASFIYDSNDHDTHLFGIDVTNDGGIAAIGSAYEVSTMTDSGGIVLIKSTLFNNSVCGQTGMGITIGNVSYTLPVGSATGISATWILSTDSVNVQAGIQLYNGCALGIHEPTVEPQPLNVFPNPMSSTFSFEYEMKTGDKIAVLNSLGEKVMEKQITERTIALNDYSPGIYFVQIIREGEIILQNKLIKSE